MSAQTHTKVIIAGGSVAGLALANMFEQLGIDYLVLEKYGKIAPDMGASIGIFPNGFRILDQLGCYNAIKALVEGADAFQSLNMMNEHGQVISGLKNASQKSIERLGYEPIFVDRQMIIQVLYDNLRDKSKVLTKQGVARVEEAAGEVKVITEGGEAFSGDILVGADGIHSTVRREMWRLADQDKPGYFPVNERENVPTEYCCIFGISHPNDKFAKYSSQNVLGQDHSYLIATGPNHRIYWFLFKKLPEVARGLYDKIPRFSDEQKDVLAAEHAQDPITDTLKFGELYASRTTATLQALPEVVFKKWHYNRIITIGDAAHKFNPIGGQGGNSAIEDAAELSNQLHSLLNSSDNGFTDASISQAFEDTQRIRFDRANKFMKDSHDQQSIQAMDKFFSRMIAKYVVPLSSPNKILEIICSGSRGAARVKALPMPKRPHSDLWDDEQELSIDVAWKRAMYAISVGVVVLAVIAVRAQFPIVPLSKALLSVQVRA